MKKKEHNYAFIDGQNLYMGTRSDTPSWSVVLKRFREYLARKYNVTHAYYFLGYINFSQQDLYASIQEAGFILMFKKHTDAMIGKKKGNVDTDIVFSIMKKLYLQEEFDSVIPVSGDGDYHVLVQFLVEQGRFKKILFPNIKFASSLYKSIHRRYRDFLGKKEIRKKIEYKKKGVLR